MTILVGKNAIEDHRGYASSRTMNHVKFLASIGLLDSLKKDRHNKWACDSIELDLGSELFEAGKNEAISKKLKGHTRGRISDELAFRGLMDICVRMLKKKPSTSGFDLEDEVKDLFLTHPRIKRRLALKLVKLERATQQSKLQRVLVFGCEQGGAA